MVHSRDARRRQLFFGEERNCFPPAAKVLPELGYIARFGESPGHADNRDTLRFGSDSIHAVTSAGSGWANAARCLRARLRAFSNEGWVCRLLNELASVLTVGNWKSRTTGKSNPSASCRRA